MKKKTEAKQLIFNPYDELDGTLDKIEKDFGLLSSSLDNKEKRISTGLLVLDLVAGRGLVAGGWYTILGAESSAKSTAAATMMANSLNSGVPILSMWDYEGSTEVTYLENIMKAQGIKIPIEEVFGVRDPDTSKYVIKPRVRMYFESVAERFFDFLARLERTLPDKVKIGDDYYFVYPNTKEMQSILKGEYDKGFFQKYNKFRIPAPDGLPQALLIVDSYPAMLPEGQDVDDPSAAMAIQARMFSDQMKRVKGKMRVKRITVVGMNQLRERPAVMYGSPVYEPCGQAIRFYCMSGDTLLFTSKGIVPASICDTSHKIFGKDSVEQPNIFGKVGEKRMVTVCTEHGYTLKAAQGHKLWATWKEVDMTGWHTIERVCAGNYSVRVVGGQDLWSGTSIDLELARSLGESYKLTASQYAEKAQVSEVDAEKLGFNKSGSNRLLFEYIATLNKDSVLEFLRGMLAKSSKVQTSVYLLSDRTRNYLRMILLNLGVHTSTKDCKQKENGKYQLNIDKSIETVLSTGRVVQKSWWEDIDEEATVQHTDMEMTWDGNMPTSHIVTNGIMSHNSDCRLQVTGRSNIYGKGTLDKELSVDGNGEDSYRYIHVRAVKNKLSTPYLEGMMRVWVSDQRGKARGFDPFFDVHQYLTMTGQLVGKRNSMRFVTTGVFDEARAFKWEELKAMIVGNKETKIDMQKKVGIKKPQDIRTFCKKQLADGDGFSRFFKAMQKVPKKSEDDE